MLGLGAYESQVMFRHLRLKMLSGEARVLRVASEDQSRYEFGSDTHLEPEYTPPIAGKPLRITATFRAEGDGVLIAQGAHVHGYALYVKDRRLCFATRHDKRLSVVESNVRLAPAPMTAVAVLAPNGQVTLALEGKIVGTGRVPGPLVKQPSDGLQVGHDAVSQVGPYEGPSAFAGRIEHVTLKVGK